MSGWWQVERKTDLFYINNNNTVRLSYQKDGVVVEKGLDIKERRLKL